jgi:hypothetical protein
LHRIQQKTAVGFCAPAVNRCTIRERRKSKRRYTAISDPPTSTIAGFSGKARSDESGQSEPNHKKSDD